MVPFIETMKGDCHILKVSIVSGLFPRKVLRDLAQGELFLVMATYGTHLIIIIHLSR